MNKLYNVESVIDFGAHKGEKMFMIFRHQISYLEWIIRKTDICFSDLAAFYKYGKIKKLNPHLLEYKKELIIEEMTNNPFTGDSNSIKIMTIKNLSNLIEKKHLTSDDFIDEDYHFSKELFIINAEKNKNCQINKRTETVENSYSHNFFFEN